MTQLSLNGRHSIENINDLSDLASRLALELQAGDLVLLSGELGAGKTTFTQCLGKALGVQEHITSPTFTLLGEYTATRRPDISRLIHIDLYRTGEQGSSQASALSNEYIQEVLDSAQGDKAVVVIEWGELLQVLPKGRVWSVSIKPGKDPNSRIVKIVLENGKTT